MKKLVYLSALCSIPLHSFAESKHQFSGELGIGVEQESTLIVDLIDTVNNTTNSARTLQVNLNYDFDASDKDKLSFSANHIRKNFQENNEFDSSLEILSGSYSREFKDYSLGVRSQVIRSDLGSRDFLNMEQLSPYISFFIGRQWFVNLSYNFADKTIATNPDRSAQSREVSADVYHFFKGINHYLLLGYRIRDENAESNLFNYVSHQIRIGWLKKWQIGRKPHKLRINWRYQRRNYDDVTNPDIGAFRVDNRRQWEVQWESQMTDDWVVLFSYRRNEQDSTLTSASYDQNTHGVRLQYQF